QRRDNRLRPQVQVARREERLRNQEGRSRDPLRRAASPGGRLGLRTVRPYAGGSDDRAVVPAGVVRRTVAHADDEGDEAADEAGHGGEQDPPLQVPVEQGGQEEVGGTAEERSPGDLGGGVGLGQRRGRRRLVVPLVVVPVVVE